MRESTPKGIMYERDLKFHRFNNRVSVGSQPMERKSPKYS